MNELSSSSRSARSAFFSLLVALAVPALGCDPAPVPADAGVDAPAVDSPFFRPDGSRSCTMDAECDDEVACTHDVCNTLGYCESRTDAASCDR